MTGRAPSEPRVRAWKRLVYHLTKEGNAQTQLNRPRPKKKRTIRDRDGNCCQQCGRQATERATYRGGIPLIVESDQRQSNGPEPVGVPLHVHHIIPLQNFGTNDPSNLITLCKKCHEELHKEAGESIPQSELERFGEALGRQDDFRW
jgi:5-methylcytosine-specific restriction endonuclease McrA